MQPEGFDLNQLLASAQQMQSQVQQAQAALADHRVVGRAGGGLVEAEVDGNGQLVGLTLDPSVVDPSDVETLADLVVVAVRDGMREAEALAQREMSAVAGGLMGGLGGGPLGAVDGDGDPFHGGGPSGFLPPVQER